MYYCCSLLCDVAADIDFFSPYLSNTLTNLCIALYCILLYCVVLNCNVLLIYCYVNIIQYNSMHKFVGVLDNARVQEIAILSCVKNICAQAA